MMTVSPNQITIIIIIIIIIIVYNPQNIWTIQWINHTKYIWVWSQYWDLYLDIIYIY